MAYDEALADRIRPIVGARGEAVERKMFGGLTWMLQGNMACGVLGDDIAVRLLPDDADRALEEPGTRRFDMTGRPARGFIVIEGAAVDDDKTLTRWVNAAADYALSLPAK